MKKEKWNPEDWQGRTRRQVEEHNTLLFYTITVGICAFLLYGVLSLIDGLI